MAEACASTRSSSEVWLIGPVSDKIQGMKLPTSRQVLSVFFHQHKIVGQTIRDSSRYAVREVLRLWAMARIPTTFERNAIVKLEEMFHRWQKLKKNINRRTATQIANETALNDDLNKLFDVAHANALTMITIAEDKAFLVDQRGPRIGYMAGVDIVLSAKEERKAKRLKRQEYLRSVEDERKRAGTVTDIVAELISEEESDTDAGDTVADEFEPCCSSTPAHTTRRPAPVMTPELSAALDRSNVSNRKATFVLAETARSLGHNVMDLAINPESIRTSRLKFREQSAQVVKAAFHASEPLVVHWDGKMLPDLTGSELVDRLPILVSGCDTEQLLGVPKLPNATGEAISHAVVTMLQEWKIQDQVKAMSFDTTAANTGRKSGACGAIETRLDKNLLYLACRHHVHEIVVGDVFKHCFGASSGPEIGLFRRFHDYWSCIDKSQFQTAVGDDFYTEVLTKLTNLKEEVIDFAKQILFSSHQPRDDYRELLELTIIFLGDTPPRGVRIMAPGAMHRARWMSKLLYCVKIWLFRAQFRLTAREETAVRDMSLFGCLLYTKAWTLCSKPAAAPNNDLSFLKVAKNYEAVNKGIDISTKRKMISGLNRQGSDDPPKRLQLDPSVIPVREIPDFVTSKTLTFLDWMVISLDTLILTAGSHLKSSVSPNSVSTVCQL